MCNYVDEEPDDDNGIELVFDEFIKPTIGYYDIPEIFPSDAKKLIMKKKISPLTEMENAQIEKFQFQNLLLYKPENIEEGLWNIYTNFGKGKFRNLSAEKGIQKGSITISDIINKKSYTHLNEGWSLRLEIINSINLWVGQNNSHEYGHKITKDKLNNIIENFQYNRKKIHIAFDIRDRNKKDLDLKTTLLLINKVLDKWGFSNIKKGKRKQTRIDGKKVDVSDYNIVGKNNDDINIYEYIKPYERRSKDDIKHPLLMCKADKRLITELELEEIRLR